MPAKLGDLRDYFRARPLSDTNVNRVRAANGAVAAAVGEVAHKLHVDGFQLASGVLPDPTPLADSVNPRRNFPTWGKLFVGGISGRDVAQGGIGDCYFLASLSALASTHPEAIANMVKQNQDGTVTVSFNQNGKPVPITVDGDLPRYQAGDWRVAGAHASSTTPGELWPALVEKAYAQWKGSYDAIGNGGNMANALRELTGQVADQEFLTGLDPRRVGEQVHALAAAKIPIVANTHTNSAKAGLVEYHVYTVEGAVQRPDGWWIQLRNPWGVHEPGNGQNDGVFMMPASTFVKDFKAMAWTKAAPT